MFVLLFIILNLTSTNGQDCEPCHCEAEIMDCTGADYISSDLFYVMISYEKVVMPTHLIDRKMLDLGITFQPTDPRECAYLCTIPYVKLTCICEVSFIKIFQLIPFVNDIYETNTTISH